MYAPLGMKCNWLVSFQKHKVNGFRFSFVVLQLLVLVMNFDCIWWTFVMVKLYWTTVADLLSEWFSWRRRCQFWSGEFTDSREKQNEWFRFVLMWKRCISMNRNISLITLDPAAAEECDVMLVSVQFVQKFKLHKLHVFYGWDIDGAVLSGAMIESTQYFRSFNLFYSHSIPEQ